MHPRGSSILRGVRIGYDTHQIRLIGLRPLLAGEAGMKRLPIELTGERQSVALKRSVQCCPPGDPQRFDVGVRHLPF